MITKQLEGGRLWKRKESGVLGWSSEDGFFDIIEAKGAGYVVLFSFKHDPVDEWGFWRKRFDTVEQAMDYAERM